MKILINILLAFNVIVSVLIVLIVLMQRPKNEGLGAAFGGGMTENLFGAQTTNVLATITRWLGGIFFGLTLLLSFLYSRNYNANRSAVLERLKNAPPAAVATPAPLIPSAATPAPVLETPGENPATPPAAIPGAPAPGTPGAVSEPVIPPAPAPAGDTPAPASNPALPAPSTPPANNPPAAPTTTTPPASAPTAPPASQPATPQ